MKSTLAKLFLVSFALTLVFTSCFKDDLLKEIDALKDTVSSMQRRNDSLSFFINAKADSLGKALTAAQKRSDSLASVLKTKSDSLSIALGITNSNLSALTKSVDSIKVQVGNINGQLTQLNNQLTSITSQLTQLNQQFGALGADYASLNAKYQELSATLQGLNTQIAALQAEQAKLLDQLNAILIQLNPPITLIQAINQSFTAAWSFSWPVIIGKSYVIKIKGLYSDGGGANNLDAAFDLRSNSAYNSCNVSIQSRWRFVNNCSIRPKVDNVSSTHIYDYYITSNTSTFDFDFKDCCYGDNSGQLTFELYEVK